MLTTISKFFKGHWHGHQSLWVSVLLVGAVQVGWLWSVETAFRKSASYLAISGPAVFIVLVLLYQAITQPVFVWWIVGAVRASLRVFKETGSRLTIVLVAGMVAIGVADVFLLATRTVPQLTAAGISVVSSIDKRSASVTVESNRLMIHGDLTDKVVSDLVKALSSHPESETLVLDSRGGRVSSALKIREIAKNNALNTFVRDECDSACIVAFVGGWDRIAAPGAKFGFHGFSVFGVAAATQIADEKKELLALGASREFVERAFDPDRDTLWFPELKELQKMNIVTEISNSP